MIIKNLVEVGILLFENAFKLMREGKKVYLPSFKKSNNYFYIKNNTICNVLGQDITSYIHLNLFNEDWEEYTEIKKDESEKECEHKWVWVRRFECKCEKCNATGEFDDGWITEVDEDEQTKN